MAEGGIDVIIRSFISPPPPPHCKEKFLVFVPGRCLTVEVRARVSSPVRSRVTERRACVCALVCVCVTSNVVVRDSLIFFPSTTFDREL